MSKQFWKMDRKILAKFWRIKNILRYYVKTFDKILSKSRDGETLEDVRRNIF